MSKKILIINGVVFRRIETDIENKKRVARRIPRPLAARIKKMKNNRVIGIIDASIVFGASRWYRGMHNMPDWEFKSKYNPMDDEMLFYEFLHILMLYDEIILDNSSSSHQIGLEIKTIFTKVNGFLGKKLIRTENISDDSDLSMVKKGVCRLIKGLIEAEKKEFISRLQNIKIPWAYNSNHIDYNEFQLIFTSLDLSEEFIPFSLFAYRAIVYSGFARNYYLKSNSPSAYLASPGRIQALSLILEKEDLINYYFPQNSYIDLFNVFRSEKSNHDFSFLRSLEKVEFSEFTRKLNILDKRDAMKKVLKLREETEAVQIRNKWAKRLSEFSSVMILGKNYSQNIEHSTINGDVYQVIYT